MGKRVGEVECFDFDVVVVFGGRGIDDCRTSGGCPQYIDSGEAECMTEVMTMTAR